MQNIIKHFTTDNCTYHNDIIIPIEFNGSKDELAFWIIEKYEQKRKEFEFDGVNVFQFYDYSFEENQIKEIEDNIFTLEEWFEEAKEKI